MSSFIKAFECLGRYIKQSLLDLGRFVLFFKEFLYWCFRRPFRYHLLFKQLEFVGNNSASIIFLSSLFTGAVLGLQLGVIFQLFGSEGMMGAATGKSLALELSPLMCGFIVTGRAGAAMAAEIATMRVNEQIDAMVAMGVNPVGYLVVPRVLASIIMMPILSGIFLFLGIFGCYLVALFKFNVDTKFFQEELIWILDWEDVQKGLIKAAFYGLFFSVIACYKGFQAFGGAKGVGTATTRAVVIGLLVILVGDFIITLFQI